MISRHPLLSRIIPAAGFVVLVAWMWGSEPPIASRIVRINKALEEGRIGRMSREAQARLEAKLEWLARNGGIEEPIYVNQGVRRDRLDVITTTPAVQALTQCGAGNAIYSPALDAIFIDHGLLEPYELTVIGTDGPVAMWSPNELDFVSSYMNFIFAHELGHRQEFEARGGRAFFHYAGHGGGSGDREVEAAADRFAVRLLLRALAASDLPSSVRERNSLRALGISHEVEGADFAVAEITGAMLLMSKALLFSVSPYSPFHEDAQHPSFLTRAATAMSVRGSLDVDAVLASHTPVFVEEIKRTASLSSWRFQEVEFPGPIARVAPRADGIWIGTRDLPTLPVTEATAHEFDDLQEHLYHMSAGDLSAMPFGPGRVLWPAEWRASGMGLSAEGVSGAFLDPLLEMGSRHLGLAAPAVTDSPRLERVFYEDPPGIDADREATEAWRFEDSGATRLLLRDHMVETASRLLGRERVTVGRLFRVNDRWSFPIAYQVAEGGGGFAVASFRAYSERSLEAVTRFIELQDGYGLVPSANVRLDQAFLEQQNVLPGSPQGISIDTALPTNREWAVASSGADSWSWWKLGVRGTALRLGGHRFLSSFAGRDSEGWFMRDIDVSYGQVERVGEGHVFLWHGQDSAYLIDLETDVVRMAFHPATANLRVTYLGSSYVLFWMQNARKGYVLDVDPDRGCRTLGCRIGELIRGW